MSDNWEIARSTETNPKHQPLPPFSLHMRLMGPGRDNFVKWLPNPVYRRRAIAAIKRCLVPYLRDNDNHNLADALHLGWVLSYAWPEKSMFGLAAIGSDHPKAPAVLRAFLAGVRRHHKVSELVLSRKGVTPPYALKAPKAAAKEVTGRNDLLILSMDEVMRGMKGSGPHRRIQRTVRWRIPLPSVWNMRFGPPL